MDEYVSDDDTFLLEADEERAVTHELIDGRWLITGSYERVENPNATDTAS